MNRLSVLLLAAPLTAAAFVLTAIPVSAQPTIPPDQTLDNVAGFDGDRSEGEDDDEPDLPSGLGDDEPASSSGPDDEPDLPSGLGGDGGTDEPGDDGSGEGSDGDSPAMDSPGDESMDSPAGWLRQLGLSGFLDVRTGMRIERDSTRDRVMIGETRLQLDTERLIAGWLTVQLTSDFVLDPVGDRHEIDLERGDGAIDLRRASVAFSPFQAMDIKVGRQSLTWGTGDLLFLNDLFPKDFQAFFMGRDDEYLKAPSDAAKLGLFTPIVNFDVVYVPRFDVDRAITGERLSYFNPSLERLARKDELLSLDIPDEWFSDFETHVRMSKNLGGVELAAYGYWGYWKSPGGFDFSADDALFPELSVYGASIRDQLAGGIANLEVAYYDSREDRDGTDLAINNSELRALLGYERQLPELASDLTIGLQYYLEWMMSHEEYLVSVMESPFARDELRHVATLRVTKQLLQQNLTVSLFTAYSPSDEDVYVRALLGYKIADCCSMNVGANVFFGSEDHTFFNQLQNNNNAYAVLRYGF